jgi:hypothetical protein
MAAEIRAPCPAVLRADGGFCLVLTIESKWVNTFSARNHKACW